MAVSLGLSKESEGFPRVNLLWDVHLTFPAACGTALSAGIQVGLGALHGAGSLSPEYMILTTLPMVSQLQTYRAKVAVSVGLSDSEAPIYPQ